MRSLTDLVGDLTDALSAAYPVRVANLAYRPGRVTCVIMPTDAEYDEPSVQNGLQGLVLTVQVHVLAAGSGDQAVVDLLTHVDPVTAIMRSAGFVIGGWTASGSGTAAEIPEIVITGTAGGMG